MWIQQETEEHVQKPLKSEGSGDQGGKKAKELFHSFPLSYTHKYTKTYLLNEIQITATGQKYNGKLHTLKRST